MRVLRGGWVAAPEFFLYEVMPVFPLKHCAFSGCGALFRGSGSYCEKHKQIAQDQRADRRRQLDRERGSAASRGYSSAWRKAREGFLARHPFCVQCEAEGFPRLAAVVDHVIPHKGDKQLFWNRNNWQPLCKRHHDLKTAAEDGGFGNMGRGGEKVK